MLASAPTFPRHARSREGDMRDRAPGLVWARFPRATSKERSRGGQGKQKQMHTPLLAFSGNIDFSPLSKIKLPDTYARLTHHPHALLLNGRVWCSGGWCAVWEVQQHKQRCVWFGRACLHPARCFTQRKHVAWYIWYMLSPGCVGIISRQGTGELLLPFVPASVRPGHVGRAHTRAHAKRLVGDGGLIRGKEQGSLLLSSVSFLCNDTTVTTYDWTMDPDMG
ncbi:hypothetical protein F5Y16DRAFT_166099 [Xylariaceae sp. FL0255]|nr:hypothetical protein F5Y16DRAFT_166099 [Xylariaceae sp. FL0255]